MILTGLCLFAMSFGPAQAADYTPCTHVAIERANKLFGPAADGTSASNMTTCIKKRNKLKAVVAWNSDIVHPSKNGLQVLNARNIMNDWEQTYGLKEDKDYQLVIVAYGKGARWAINNKAYRAKFGQDHPSLKEVKSLIKRGAKIYMCQNSMKGNGWKTKDLIEGVNMVPSGVTALIDFQNQAYIYIAP